MAIITDNEDAITPAEETRLGFCKICPGIRAFLEGAPDGEGNRWSQIIIDPDERFGRDPTGQRENLYELEPYAKKLADIEAKLREQGVEMLYSVAVFGEGETRGFLSPIVVTLLAPEGLLTEGFVRRALPPALVDQSTD